MAIIKCLQTWWKGGSVNDRPRQEISIAPNIVTLIGVPCYITHTYPKDTPRGEKINGPKIFLIYMPFSDIRESSRKTERDPSDDPSKI